ncbi:MAG: response regulator transcription factor [Oscillospiraceae bacterium]|nr:response regulator transcription factor [Oscillospiraceae bacterium]
MIWCIEDDASIRDIEVYALKSTGFEARGFEDGSSFFEALKNETPRLVILDVMLPGDDGTQILKKMKENVEYADIPVIMATAKGNEYDKVQSLDLGADDYLVKPFGMMEMISRVRAVLRRCSPKQDNNVMKIGELTINIKERTLYTNDEAISLTYNEFELLKLFVMNPKMVFTREQIYSNIWESDFIGETRTVDMHVRTLRQKLGEYGNIIKTVRNVGYRLEINQ